MIGPCVRTYLVRGYLSFHKSKKFLRQGRVIFNVVYHWEERNQVGDPLPYLVAFFRREYVCELQIATLVEMLHMG